MILPIRHHSPACARYVRNAILRERPAAVLIEGPSDFNERIGELYLGHRPPISIYSYVAWRDGRRQGAYYPLCAYSPEWQALLAARECGAEARFIDLPFAMLAREDARAHRYGDERLRASDYLDALCRALGVENFDDAWDLIAEQDPAQSEGETISRVASYCRCLREMDGTAVSGHDLRREAYMAGQVRAAWAAHGRDRVLVVTGGYHTSGLEAMLADETAGVADTALEWPDDLAERGIALTPYSYERLDSLTGYDAGMPSPGFYHQAWQAEGGEVHAPLLMAVAGRLRELKQAASTADLIAVESCARALASLRGHARVWRRDLTDAIVAALVKDDLHAAHPFVLAMRAVLRGGERGLLAPGSPRPPLVADIESRLTGLNLAPEQFPKEISLALTKPGDLEASRLLHMVRLLEIPGYERVAGVNFAAREDLTTLTETWRVRWTPEQDARTIESSRYGSALDEAVAAKLREEADALDRGAGRAALLLLDAVLAGVMPMAVSLRTRVAEIVHEDGDLASVAEAMGHLLYLFSWDDTLGARGSAETGALLKDAFDRGIWLLEAGSPGLPPRAEVESVRLLRDAFERAEGPMGLDRGLFAESLRRVQADAQRSPAQRGACAGALWSLHRAEPESIRRDLRLFAAPEQMGDFLAGLFALAREEAQRDAELMRAVNGTLVDWDDEAFLAALPSLRLAFMYFTAREKVYLARGLFDAGSEEPAPLAVSTADAARAMAFEHGLADLAKQYGIRLEITP
ncbi:MAG: hypothetical protein JNK37_08740 [Verrucomicrobiales bacterium]|nr:hypothetical protein [Verrucomicrobiales bacterium]